MNSNNHKNQSEKQHKTFAFQFTCDSRSIQFVTYNHPKCGNLMKWIYFWNFDKRLISTHCSYLLTHSIMWKWISRHFRSWQTPKFTIFDICTRQRNMIYCSILDSIGASRLVPQMYQSLALGPVGESEFLPVVKVISGHRSICSNAHDMERIIHEHQQ